MIHGLFSLISFAIVVYSCYWVYTDAQKRGMPAVGWAIGTFFCWPIVPIIYLIMRKPVV
jgi:hypothetical protein